MDSSALHRYDLQVEVFKALAHPMRLLLLEKIRERPRCVCDLADEVGIDKSVASKHLSQLKRAGVIEDMKRGTLVEYRLVAPCVLSLASCAEGVILKARKKSIAGTGASALRPLIIPNPIESPKPLIVASGAGSGLAAAFEKTTTPPLKTEARTVPAVEKVEG